MWFVIVDEDIAIVWPKKVGSSFHTSIVMQDIFADADPAPTLRPRLAVLGSSTSPMH